MNSTTRHALSTADCFSLDFSRALTCEQWIKEGKNAIKWTRLSCRSFDANAVRLQLHGLAVRPQLHALAYNLGNFLRSLAIPEAISGPRRAGPGVISRRTHGLAWSGPREDGRNRPAVARKGRSNGEYRIRGCISREPFLHAR